MMISSLVKSDKFIASMTSLQTQSLGVGSHSEFGSLHSAPRPRRRKLESFTYSTCSIYNAMHRALPGHRCVSSRFYASAVASRHITYIIYHIYHVTYHHVKHTCIKQYHTPIRARQYTYNTPCALSYIYNIR